MEEKDAAGVRFVKKLEIDHALQILVFLSIDLSNIVRFFLGGRGLLFHTLILKTNSKKFSFL